MAPTPPDLTDKLFVKFEGLSGVHEIMFRFPPATTPTACVTAAQAIVNAMKPLFPTSTQANSARFSDSGDPLSFPIAWTPIVGTNPTVMVPADYPKFFSFVGRSVSGVRARITLQAAPFPSDNNYRVLSSENAAVAATIAALTNPANLIVAADNQAVVWNPYANLGYNAYFQRKRRTSV